MHTAHAVGGAEEEIAPGDTAISIDGNAVTFYIGSGIALRLLAAKVNAGHFDPDGLNLQIRLTADIDLAVYDVESELKQLEDAYALLEGTPIWDYINIEEDLELLNGILSQLQGSDGVDPDKSWTPMGTMESPFSGSFDGCGYEISGLNIAVVADETGNVSTPFTGLVGLLMDGCVQNLTVKIGTITASAAESSSLYAGMIVGSMENSLLNNCKASGEITVTAAVQDSGTVADSTAVGGLVGLGMSSGIINCSSETAITVENILAVGGIAGALVAETDENGNAAIPCIANSYSVGTITGSAGAGGGLVGYAAASLVNNYFYGEIELIALSAVFDPTYEPFGNGSMGTIVGVLTNAAEDTELSLDLWYNYFPAGYCPEDKEETEDAEEIPESIAPLYNLIVGKAIGCADVSSMFQQGILMSLAELQVFTPLVAGTDTPESLCADLNTQLWRSHQVLEEQMERAEPGALVEQLGGKAPKALCWSVNTSGYPVQYACAYAATGEECTACGRGASHTIKISTEDELFALAEAVNSGIYAGQSFHPTEINLTVELTQDIELTQPWTPMGTLENPFSGNFDGRGHTISGLSVEILEVVVPDTRTDEGNDDGSDTGDTGDPLVQPAAEPANITIEGFAVQYTEGLVTEPAGEPAAQDETTTDSSGLLALAEVLRDSISHAGFIGYLYEGGVQNLTVDGNITVTTGATLYHVGMIAGGMKDSIINNCRTRGTVDVRVMPADSNAKQGVAPAADVSINSGDLIDLDLADFSAMSSTVGGLVGQGLRSIIINCGNEADVYVENLLFAGGIAGALMTEGDWMVLVFCLLNSYSVGTITGALFGAGGLVGYAADSLINNYFAGRILLPSGSSDSDSALGTLAGVLTNIKDLYAGEGNWEFLDLDFWYNHFPLGYLPELPVDAPAEPGDDTNGDDNTTENMTAGIIGAYSFDDALNAKIEQNLAAGRVIVPYAITEPADSESGRAYDIADPQTLSDALNAQLELTNEIIAGHMSNLQASPWSHLIEKMNGYAVQLMCWAPGTGGYPVQNTCVYETSGGEEACPICGRNALNKATINSVDIAWGSMAFEYGESGWEPCNTDGNLLTICNTGEKYVHIALAYTPIVTEVSASMEFHITEDGVDVSEIVPLSSQPMEGDLPPPAPESGWDGQITGYLLLEGEPTETLNNVPLGTITITISEPKTEVTTWGHQHDNDNPLDPIQIYWVAQIIGSVNSSIPGSKLTSELLPAVDSAMGNHEYTDADMQAGITVGVSQLDANGVEIAWYNWKVSPGDMDWSDDRSRWSYTIPSKIPGTEITLGNEGWVYFIDYTSTTIPEDEGIYGHMNRVEIDGQTAEGWVGVEHTEAHGNIVPFGTLGDDGYFHWDIKAIIPGLQDGEEADYFWYIMDYLEVFNGYDRAGYVENDLGDIELTTVTATYNQAGQGITIPVPHITEIESGGTEPFAWNDHWSAETGGVAYGKHLDLLCRCNCTATTCPFWTGDAENGTCGSLYHSDDSEEFCQCWTAAESVTFTFSYRTPVASVSQYGGLNLVNRAELWRSAEKTQDVWEGILVDILDVSIPIPTTTPSSVSNDNGTPEPTTEPGETT